MQIILKKLDLEDILEKELDLWCQSSGINPCDTSVGEINTSNQQLKVSDNLTNKISETIQNIKIKKQNNFYTSQMPNPQIKTNSSKVMKILPKVTKQDATEVVYEEDIFVINSRKKTTKPLKSSTPSTTSSIPTTDNSNSSCMKRKSNNSQSPLPISLNTGQLARIKLSAFTCKQKPTSTNNDNQVKLNISKPPPTQKQSDFSTMFSTGDEDDLSYLDIV